MLTAYFDDSGTDLNSPLVVVAGYLSSDHMWESFNVRWANLLLKNGVTQMRRSKLESLEGEFKGWIPDQRTEFVKKAHAVIRKFTYLPIGIAIVKADFEEAFPVNSTARRFGLYSWCIHGCLAALGEWCEKRNHREPITFVFEAGTEGRDQVHKTFTVLCANPEKRPPRACPIKSWSFAPKKVLPLQAADLIAYEFYKFTKNHAIDRGRHKIRLSALDLFSSTDISLLKYFDKKGFEALRTTGVPGWDY